jgi:hypothetical protein
LDPDVVPQRWLYGIRDPEGKCVDAFSSDGQNDVQQTFVRRFHISYFTNSNAEPSQGRAILPPGLLLQKTSREIVRSTGRWRIHHRYPLGLLLRSDQLVG